MEKYDVAFSFAGEDRSFTEKTVKSLQSMGFRVFYDKYEEADLLGKDLYQYLTKIYSDEARYCVIMISKNYKNKLWTNHELKSAQARAFQESREYILPARFDDTEIPGLLPTIGYIDLRNETPESFAEIIGRKIQDNKPILDINDQVDRKLETELANAVILAEDYLAPQSLIVSDSIAELVRKSFAKAGLKPLADYIIPYLRNKSASYRVVGYFAFQVSALQGLILTDLTEELVACLSRERRETIEKYKETRPLWQLLVCFHFLLKTDIESDRKSLVGEALKGFLEFMRSDNTIDLGGECKWRVKELIIGFTGND
jgi:hypothetical protein